MDAAKYYIDHLKEIDEAIGIICRKHGIPADKEKDFTQHVHLQLIEDDYKKIRAYRGSSSLKTYLYTVISRILIDQVRTKWHPSTEAKAMGATAIKLEKLVFRNNYSVHEACQILAMNPSTVIDENAAHAVLANLRTRRPRPLKADDSEEQLPRLPDPSPDPEKRIAHRQLQRKKQEIIEMIGALLRSFSSEDKLLIKLIFLSGHKISAAARLLKQDERLTYRRTQTLLRNLREEMAAAGIAETDVREIFEGTGASDE